MLSVPTDCPQREKMSWTGDMTVYIETALQNQDLTEFISRWLEQFALCQLPDGQIPNVVPTPNFYHFVSKLTAVLLGGKFGEIGSAGWGDAAVFVPFELYQATGNTEILEKQYVSMKKWVEYMRIQTETKGINKYLWDTGFQFGEWLIPSATKHGTMSSAVRKSAKLGRKYIAPVFYYLSVSKLAETARVIGKSEDAEFYGSLAGKIKTAYQKAMINPDGKLIVDVQGAYALALGAGLVPENLVSASTRRLVNLIHDNGDRLDMGFLATPYLLDALCDNGYSKLAFTLLFQDQRPSWLFEVDNGATTIWENWNSEDEKGKKLKISHNHYAFGCVADWIYRKIGGITRTGIAYDSVLIMPELDDRITWAKRTFISPKGLIACEWKRVSDKFSLRTEIPSGVVAKVVLPNGESVEASGGVFCYECPVKPVVPEIIAHEHSKTRITL
jgi:alpha-L-rhamnosidase